MNRKILGVSFLQAVIIAAILLVYFQLSSVEMHARLVRSYPFVERPPWYFNLNLFLGTLLLFQAGLFHFLARKFLKTTKEVVVVSSMVFILLGLYPVLSSVPAFFNYVECREVLVQEKNAFDHQGIGECFTFMENAKAFVVIPMFFVYLTILSGINICSGVQGLKRMDRHSSLN